MAIHKKSIRPIHVLLLLCVLGVLLLFYSVYRVLDAENDRVSYSQITWSPNGKYVLLKADGRAVRPGLHMVSLDNFSISNQLTIYEYRTGYAQQSPAVWAPDSNAIVFVGEALYGNRYETDIFWQSLDGSPPLNLTNTSVYDSYPDISPDGNRIAFVSSSSEINLMDRDGSNVRQLVHLDKRLCCLSWSPDNSVLSFIGSDDYYSQEVFLFNVATSSLTNLTKGPTTYGQPLWSRDGKQLTFVKEPKSNTTNVLLVVADLIALPSNLKVLNLDSSFAYLLNWSPDNRRVLYGSLNGLQIIDTQNGEITLINTFQQFNAFWTSPNQVVSLRFWQRRLEGRKSIEFYDLPA